MITSKNTQQGGGLKTGFSTKNEVIHESHLKCLILKAFENISLQTKYKQVLSVMNRC